MRTSQTSLIVDPPDGRYPTRTDRVRESDAALNRAAALAARRTREIGIRIDAPTFMAVTITLAGIAASASYLPARGTALADTLNAIRCE